MRKKLVKIICTWTQDFWDFLPTANRHLWKLHKSKINWTHINISCPIIGLIDLIFGIKYKYKLFIVLNILLILLLPSAMIVGHIILVMHVEQEDNNLNSSFMGCFFFAPE